MFVIWRQTTEMSQVRLLTSLPFLAQLDVILSWFANNPKAKPSATISDLGNYINETSGDGYKDAFRELLAELQVLVNYLVEDGYIKSETRDVWPDLHTATLVVSHEEIFYSTTFKGLDYDLRGGFYAEEVREMEKVRIAELQKEVEANQNKLVQIQAQASIDNVKIQKELVTLNKLLVFAASVAALYYILEILKDQYNLGLPFHVHFK